MLRRPLRSTRTDTLFPYTTRFRSDIEIPDEQGGQGERLGPARHPLDEIELLPEFGIERAIGDVAAGGHVDVLDPHPVRQPRSEEHTSELQSLMRISYAVFCLKKQKYITKHQKQQSASEQTNT